MRLTGVKRGGKASRFEGLTPDVMKDLLRLITMAFSMRKTGASQEVLVLKNPPANAGDACLGLLIFSLSIFLDEFA